MTINGKDRILVLAGGMTKPPHGGLLCIDPRDGTIDSAFPWRSASFASVNAASPVFCENGRVFITEDYGLGGVMLQYDEHFQPRILWQSENFNSQFQTPVYHRGFLYGFTGNGGLLISLDASNGRPLWNRLFVEETVIFEERKLAINFGKGSLMAVDDRFLALGENGTLAWLDLSSHGAFVLSKAQPFYQPESWALPSLANGKLYVSQSYGEKRRILCYDLTAPQP